MKKIFYSIVALLGVVNTQSSAQTIPITSGLVAHFDDAATNYSISGSNAVWVDNISSIQAKMNQATFIPPVVTHGTYTGLGFNISQYLVTDTLAAFNSSSPTIFTVKRGPVSNYIYSCIASLSTGNANQEFYLGDRAAYHVTSSGNFYSREHQCTNSITDTGFVVATAAYSKIKNDFAYYINGVATTSSIASFGTSSNHSTVNRMLGIGSRISWYTNERYKGEIYEVIVYDRQLSDVEVQQVTNYLFCKYNIVGTFCGTTMNCEIIEDPEDPNEEDPEDPNEEDPEDPNEENPEDPNEEDPEDPNEEDPKDPKSILDIKFGQYFDLYPNPASSFVNIDLKQDRMVHLTIFDAFGRQLQQMELRNSATIDISKYSNGVYLFRLGNNDIGYYWKKIIKTSNLN